MNYRPHAGGRRLRLNRNGFSLIVKGVAPGRLDEAVPLGKYNTDALCVIPSGTPCERAATLTALAAGEGIEETQAALADWVGGHGIPDAVMGCNNQIAIAALQWLQAGGHDVPGDVKVTGFNGFAFRRYASPTLTSIHSPALALGEQAG